MTGPPSGPMAARRYSWRLVREEASFYIRISCFEFRIFRRHRAPIFDPATIPNPTAAKKPSSLLTEPPLNPTHPPFHVDRILKPAEPEPRRDHKVIAVLPAYNAASTLHATIADFPPG